MPARNQEGTLNSDTVSELFKISIVLASEYEFQFLQYKDCFYFADLNCNNLNVACTNHILLGDFRDFH